MGAGASSRLQSLASDRVYNPRASEQNKESGVVDHPLIEAYNNRVGPSESGSGVLDTQAVPKNEIIDYISASATGSISAARSEEEIVAQINTEVNKMIMKCNVPLLKNSSQGTLHIYIYLISIRLIFFIL
jgi:hypothetical protein